MRDNPGSKINLVTEMSQIVCEICGKRLPEGSKCFIVGEKGEKIGLCSECQGPIVLNGIRYDVDIMIVPVKQESLLNAIKNRIYICPSHYVRKRPKFIAFYVGGEKGLITHLAKVQCIEDNVPFEKLFKKESPDTKFGWKRHRFFKVFRLCKVIGLKNPIRRNHSPPIQNRMYVAFKRLVKAKNIEDLK